MNGESYTIKSDMFVREHFIALPLDYQDPMGAHIRVFVRETRSSSKATASDAPLLLYLQGGPGFGCKLDSGGFGAEFREKGHVVLYLDQRGTGLSTPISAEMLATKPVEEQYAYLTHFRADNIVRDCEAIRQKLFGGRKWTILGQSFGGFCALTYLSFAPSALEEVFITGGLAPIALRNPKEVYEATWRNTLTRNQVYYNKYPADKNRVKTIAAHLDSDCRVSLPNGTELSTPLFQCLGIAFGAHGGIDSVHQLVLQATNDLELFGKLTYATLLDIQNAISFERNPIYALLHEAIYCQGEASEWAAKETMPDAFRSSDVLFYGEMVLPVVFQLKELRAVKQVAKLLAEKDDWPKLYDLETLKRNTVKVSAITYFDDMYVDFDWAQDTASLVGNLKQHITNEWQHSALRTHAKQVVEKLLALSKREED